MPDLPNAPPDPRSPRRRDDRWRAVARRTALLVAGALVAALLGPFFVAYFAG